MNYIPAEELWFAMHPTERSGDSSLAVTCYLDDSGSHEQSQWVVAGSCLMRKATFLVFDLSWLDMLEVFKIEAVHMQDFIKPHGKHSSWYPEMKIALFNEVVRLVNLHKIYSLGVVIPNADYQSLFPIEVYRKLMGPYAFAFMATMIFNCGISQKLNYTKRIAYLGDKSTESKKAHSHDAQLNSAHSVISEWERRKGFSNVGTITFAPDECVSALQAADAIAWTTHRKEESEDFGKEFEPLLGLFSKQFNPLGKQVRFHHTLKVPKEGLINFAYSITNWMNDKGTLPTLEEMMGIKLDEKNEDK